MDAWAEWASRGENTSWEDNYVYLLRWHDLAYVIAGTLYFPTVYGLQSFMRTREPFSLKPLLVFWNTLLALYSLYSSIFLFPILYQLVSHRGFEASVCETEHYDFPSSSLVYVFGLSKVAEFADTVFLVLRKRPLIQLHVQHHIITFWFTWMANVYSYRINGSGYWFATMNVVVHSIMYAYYALAAAGYGRILAAAKLNVVITTIQIVQMVMGIIVLFTTQSCPVTSPLYFALGLAMYALYLVLFAKLFIDKYVARSPKPGSKQKIK